MDKIKRHWAWYLISLVVVIAAAAWWMLRSPGLPDGFASSNGRIEATEVDIATKTAGRIERILVSEGQFVRQGDVLAQMDTRVLNEQRLEAAAQIKEAHSAVAAARALLEQRQSEMRATESVVKQRQAELNSTSKRHARSSTLSQRGAVSAQQLDDDRAAAESGRLHSNLLGRRFRPPKRRLKRLAPALFRHKLGWKLPKQPNDALWPISTTAR